jgi:hypothetical protein
MMKVARAQHPTDNGAFFLALDNAVGANVDAMHPGAISVLLSEEISILILPRYVTYRQMLAEAIRLMDPIESTPVPDGVQVVVSPSTFTAPDILRIVVTRNGTKVEPISDGLAPKTFVNGFGAPKVMHAGTVTFPCSAFAPAASVDVIAIPDDGANYTHHVAMSELSAMR